jgi:hypothetical protein
MADKCPSALIELNNSLLMNEQLGGKHIYN